MIEGNIGEKIKIAFSKVKEDMINLEKEIEDIKSLINYQKDKNDLIFQKIEELLSKKPNKEEFKTPKENISIGNEGVYADMRADMRADMHKIEEKNPSKHPFDRISDIDKMFLDLTKKEFLIFLTIYQMEEDIEKVSYDDLSSHFKLTPGCIRTHISNMMKKGIPISRKKFNNKLTLFSISPEFRALNLKSRLFNLYNNQDPYQKKLI